MNKGPYDLWKDQIYSFLQVSKGFINKDIRRVISWFVKFDFTGEIGGCHLQHSGDIIRWVKCGSIGVNCFKWKVCINPCHLCLLPLLREDLNPFGVNFRCINHGTMFVREGIVDSRTFNNCKCYISSYVGIFKSCINLKKFLIINF